jgi:hypothetical protein
MPFLTQLLPLLVFLAVDAFVTDVRVSIACAVVFAAGQLAVTFVRTRRLDWFVLLDVALIVGLGAMSLGTENDLFFKVKPAIAEGVALALVVGLMLAPDRFLAGYLGRFMPGRTLGAGELGNLKSLLGVMAAGTAVHLGLVLYTALRSSRAVWAFVSGPGFYLLLLPLCAGFVLLTRRRQARAAGPEPEVEEP